MILDMKWLASVGETNDDWKRLSMTMIVDNKEIVLRGDPALSKSIVLANAMRKLLEMGHEGMVINICLAHTLV